MSRELKFRVWSYRLKRFLSKEEYYLDFDGNLYFDDYGDGHEVNTLRKVSKENYTVKQFTGIFDKNGKEIYEGDIVNFKDYNSIDDFTIDVNLVCIYSIYNAWYSFVVDVENEHDEGYYWMEIKEKCEVVGNIFEKL